MARQKNKRQTEPVEVLYHRVEQMVSLFLENTRRVSSPFIIMTRSVSLIFNSTGRQMSRTYNKDSGICVYIINYGK